MSDENLLHQVDQSILHEPIKTHLGRLILGLEEISPSLDLYHRRRSGYTLGLLVKEVIDPSIEPHWWESVLDLISKIAVSQGESGVQVRQAVDQLRILLPSHMNSYGPVTLREISKETVFGIIMLSDTLTEPKSNFVAPNVYSLAQAHFNPHAWFRAIYAGKAPVGFLMMVDNPQDAEYFLWRFMIAEPFHGRGYGRQAIARLVEYVRMRPEASELKVSCGQGEGSPEGFYLKLGLVHTGEKLGDEVVLKLKL